MYKCKDCGRLFSRRVYKDTKFKLLDVASRIYGCYYCESENYEKLDDIVNCFTLNKNAYFQLEYNEDYLVDNGDYYCELLDQHGSWITDIYNKRELDQLSEISCISEIQEILGFKNITWGDSLQELFDNIKDIYDVDINENYDFIYFVGGVYFIVDFE